MLHTLTDSRYKAALIHLAASALVALTIVLGIILIWYPGPTINATGAAKIFFLVIGVDVCLGPLLTLVVFDKKKPELPRDLSIILGIQLLALAYGLYTVSIARPVYYVFAIDRFELVQATEFSDEKLNLAKEENFKSLPWGKAQWISAIPPESIEEKNELLFSAVDGGSDLAQTPKYYTDYSVSISEITKRAKPLVELEQFNPPEGNDKVKKLLAKYNDSESYGYLPMTAKKQDLTVIIDLKNGKPLETIDLIPW